MPNVHAKVGHRMALLATATLIFCLGAPLAATADAKAQEGTTLQSRVNEVLASHPGGAQIGPNEVAWNGGTVILTLEVPGIEVGPLAVGSCATGSYCAYSGYSLTGNKLSFTSCVGSQPVGALGTVRSIANARITGSVRALNAGGGTLATIAANSSIPFAPAGVTYLACP